MTAKADPKANKASLWAGPIALALGFGLGAWAHSAPGAVPWLLNLTEPIGTLWVNALRVAVMPLAVCLLVTGVCSIPSRGGLGRWGGLSLVTFLGLLILGSVVAVAIGVPYLSAFGPNAAASGIAPALGESPSLSLSEWFIGLIPTNLADALSGPDLLPVIVMSALFGLALRGIQSDRRQSVLAVFEGVRDAVLLYVRWVVKLLAVGAFCLAYSFAARQGGGFAGPVLHFLLYTCGLIAGFAALMLVLASAVGRVPLGRLLRGVWPSLEIGLGTRSSLAAVPSLVEGSRSMGLPEPASSVVIPMAASLLKVNRPLSAITKLLFCTSMFGIAVGPTQLMAFILTVLLLSIATPGVPSAGSKTTLAAYLAAGAPLEGILLLEATDSITDIVKTACNVSGYMASAVAVSRFAGQSEGESGPFVSASEPVAEIS